MELLPDDVLVEVMKYLDVPSLMTCRLVCKRLGGLALHPDAWRDRYLPASGPVPACAVLRLAPCLEGMSVKLQSAKCILAYTTTRCAVSRLLLEVAGSHGLHAALIIRNQEALGRLRCVEVEFCAPRVARADVSVLWGTVAATRGLEQLHLDCPGLTVRHMDSLTSHCTPPRPSLKYIQAELSSKSQNFNNLVLSAHAPTLDLVHISNHSYGRCPTSTATATILAGMPNLRQLYCPLQLPGLEAVAACESLRELHLHVCAKTEVQDVAGAAGLLRRATQLRELNVHYDCDPDEIAYKYGYDETIFQDLIAELVRALASSGRSRIESLAVWDPDTFEDDTFPSLRQLLAALPSLKHLRHLRLQAAPDELLLGITPDTAPALQRLALRLRSVDYPPCAHAWLHRDAVKQVLSVNPSLELFVTPMRLYCSQGACVACALGCHLRLWDSIQKEFCLFDDEWILIPRG
ncbi:uncharacterized protein LOC113211853 [Frankliniella occidentalis]|uniref:Uncharacterized protein LOC113211853 n=1 Tax=Frankliniella occidentalis TaxID=133901 RepID=A0A6J1SZA3_FRAOC|nr:uncharacterized protein LOC113211853 [Frankliniella occidentalis]